MNKYKWLPLWVKRVIWFLFYKWRGHEWYLPGPTSKSHPFGWMSPFERTCFVCDNKLPQGKAIICSEECERQYVADMIEQEGEIQ